MGSLTGLRILDISTIIAAPSAATLLADYGADVVKVELPKVGDGARGFPPFKDGKPLWWKVINRGKRFITLDLRKPEGAQLLLQMLPKFDVLIENFRPGTLDAWGLDAKALWQAQPRLVILRTTGFGQTGPYKDRPGFARLFEAMGGLTHITGEPNGEPMHSGYPLADNVGGIFGALAVMTALWRRDKTPADNANPESVCGEEIDLSLSEAMLKVLEFLPIELNQLGTIRQRSGNANQYSAPAAVYQTSDQCWVSLSGSTNPLFANNCRAIGRADLIDNPSYANNAQRVHHASELNLIFSNWCKTHTYAQVMAAFETAQGTIAPIYDIAQIEADPHFQAREAICDVPDQDFGVVRMANVVPRFKHHPTEIKASAGNLGQDTDTFYQQELGLSLTDLARLREHNII